MIEDGLFEVPFEEQTMKTTEPRMQNVLLHMEEVNSRVPFIALASAMHALNHLHFGGIKWEDPMHGMVTVITYIALGLLLPLLMSAALHSSKANKVTQHTEWFHSSASISVNR